jgi:hypothetical protein
MSEEELEDAQLLATVPRDPTDAGQAEKQAISFGGDLKQVEPVLIESRVDPAEDDPCKGIVAGRHFDIVGRLGVDDLAGVRVSTSPFSSWPFSIRETRAWLTPMAAATST